MNSLMVSIFWSSSPFELIMIWELSKKLIYIIEVLEIKLLIQVLEHSFFATSSSIHDQVLEVLLLLEVLKPGGFERNIDELLEFRLQSVQVLKAL